MLRFRAVGRTHDGLIRPHNEDAGYVGPYFLLVADGVGGSVAGEVAAASTAYVVTSAVLAGGSGDPMAVLTDAIGLSHDHLMDGCRQVPERRGMSTTLTALLCDGERIAVAHIGDSRAYRWHRGELTQITTDHTLVQSLIDDGHLSAEQAMTYPYRNVVLKALNADDQPQPDTEWVHLAVGDLILVCSDGLSDLVSDELIARTLRTAGSDAAALGDPGVGAREGDRFDLDLAVDRLIQAALAAGGRDNVTCVLAEVIQGDRTLPFGTALGAFVPDNLINGTACRLTETSTGGRAIVLDHSLAC